MGLLGLALGCATPAAPTEDGDLAWRGQRRLVRTSAYPELPERRLKVADVPRVQTDLYPGALADVYPLPEEEHEVAPGVLEVYNLNTQERVSVRLFSAQGGYAEDAAEDLTWIFRDWRQEVQCPMEPRLLTILYLLGQVYRRPLVLVSGYRKAAHRASSRHHLCAAADVRVPGVPMEELSLFVKSHFEQVGVGIYPNSDFVHVDVREQTYYWLDPSGPGESKKERALELDPLAEPGSDWTLFADDLPPVWRY